MAILFNFNPPTGLRDKAFYPSNPASEDAARQQVQNGMDQIKTFINTDIKNEFGFYYLKTETYKKDEIDTKFDTKFDNKFTLIAPTTYVNSWVSNLNAPQYPLKYYKDSAGIVHIEGHCSNGTAALILTMPTGYLPMGDTVFTVPYVNSSSVWTNGILRIDANGQMITQCEVGRRHYINISYIAKV